MSTDDVIEALESIPGINDDLPERQAAREQMEADWAEARTADDKPEP